MKNLPYALTALLIPSIILLYLYCTPYTKVEESFSIQAVHDFLRYGTPPWTISSLELLPTHTNLFKFDHISFPGPVPRSFLGPLILAYLSKPWIHLYSPNNPLTTQLIVRATLGLTNALSLISLREAFAHTYGNDVAIWFTILQIAQFHVNFYASRTLPNSFALPFTNLAFTLLVLTHKHNSRFAILILTFSLALLVFCAAVFRMEISLLAATASLISYFTIPSSRFSSSSSILTFSYPLLFSFILPAILGLLPAYATFSRLDSILWSPVFNHFEFSTLNTLIPPLFLSRCPKFLSSQFNHTIWPELSAFWFNVIHNRSKLWGSQPAHYYFTFALPRMLFNSFFLTLSLTIAWLFHPSIRPLLSLCIVYTLIMSMLDHKELRFIIYIAPVITGIMAIGIAETSRVFYPSKPFLHKYPLIPKFSRFRKKRILKLLIVLASIFIILITASISLVRLGASRLNYPGGVSITLLQDYLSNSPRRFNILNSIPLPSSTGDLKELVKDHKPLYNKSTQISVYNLNEYRIVPIHLHITNLALQTGVTRFLTSTFIPVSRNLTIIPPVDKPVLIQLVVDKSDVTNLTLLEKSIFFSKIDIMISESSDFISPPLPNNELKLTFTNLTTHPIVAWESAHIIRGVQNWTNPSTFNALLLGRVYLCAKSNYPINFSIIKSILAQPSELICFGEYYTRKLSRGRWIQVNLSPKLWIGMRIVSEKR